MRRLPVCLLAAAAFLPAPALANDGDTVEERRRQRRSAVVKAVERVAPAVVSIGTTQLVKSRYLDWFGTLREATREQQGALGSGVIVHPDGYVITNAHVIARAAKIFVLLTGLGEDERQLPATLLDVDLSNDLALLRIDEGGPYQAIGFGRSDDLMVGETVIAVGSPFGLGRTVSTGVVSAIDRSVTINRRSYEGWIQTDAAVNQGNSGGALLNVLGEWIGVNSAIYSLSGGSDGISFAIPVDRVRAFLARALHPRRLLGRWIGLELGESDGAVVVAHVYGHGPARKAGVRPGARVVTLDGKTPAGLSEAGFALLAAGRRGKVTLRLDDGRERRDVTLSFVAPPINEIAWRRLGARFTDGSDGPAETEGFSGSQGLVLTELRGSGPAGRVRLRKGDVLTSLGTTRLRTMDDLLVYLETAPAKESVEVRIVRPFRTPGGRVTWNEQRGKVTLE